MIGGSKFIKFRTWANPSSEPGTNGDRLHSFSKPDAREWETRIKVAQFFILSALLFVLADYLGRVQDRTGAILVPDSTSLVQLILSPPERPRDNSGFTVRFRLSNKVNHSLSYPTATTTKGPLGQLIARASSQSDWMSPSGNSVRIASSVEGLRASE